MEKFCEEICDSSLVISCHLLEYITLILDGYKYRILTRRNVLIPNNGWENIPNRRINITEDNTEAPYAEFNHLRRVARFILDTEQWEMQNKFRPLKGDILQIRLLLDENESYSDALVWVNKYKYETAVAIPLTAIDIKWQVIKNMKDDLTEMKTEEVNLKGKIITNF